MALDQREASAQCGAGVQSAGVPGGMERSGYPGAPGGTESLAARAGKEQQLSERAPASFPASGKNMGLRGPVTLGERL